MLWKASVILKMPKTSQSGRFSFLITKDKNPSKNLCVHKQILQQVKNEEKSFKQKSNNRLPPALLGLTQLCGVQYFTYLATHTGGDFRLPNLSPLEIPCNLPEKLSERPSVC